MIKVRVGMAVDDYDLNLLSHVSGSAFISRDASPDAIYAWKLVYDVLVNLQIYWDEEVMGWE